MKTPLLFLKLVAFAWLLAPDSAVAFCNPQTGRWLNRDPIAETGGRNLHHFNYNDAVGHIDTAGKQSYLTGSFPIPWPALECPPLTRDLRSGPAHFLIRHLRRLHFLRQLGKVRFRSVLVLFRA